MLLSDLSARWTIHRVVDLGTGIAVTAFADLEVGLELRGAAVTIDHELVATVIEQAGYVHPLFTDPNHRESSMLPGPPIPGSLLLVLLGAMAEQLETFGAHVVALTGFDEVRFDRMSVGGATVTPSFSLLALEPARSGRGGTAVWRWVLDDDDGSRVCSAIARLRTH